jgi:hypothetical protein
LVAVTVAVAFWNVRTSALVDLTRTVAHAARVVSAHAVVDVVANAIGVFVRSAVTTTHAKCVELVAITVAVTVRDVRASTFVDFTRTVAQAARVIHAHAFVDVVANAIGIFVRFAVTTTHAKCVELVAVTVAVVLWDVSTSARVDCARTVAHATCVVRAYAVVYVIANAIGIFVR